MSEFIVALSIVFVVAGVLLILANHLGLPAVPFYIIAGLLSGWVITQDELIELALWGIAFLVFVFGTRVNFSEFQSVLRDGEVAAFAQYIIIAPIAFGIGYVVGDIVGFDDPFRNALYFSAAATFSSTLVGAQLLEQEIRNNLVHGRLASSIHFIDDLVAIGAILILSADVITDVDLITSNIGYGVLFILVGLVIYRHGFPLLQRMAGSNDELVLMGSVSILIAFIAAAEIVGISLVVGAFAAGLGIRSDGAQSLSVRNGLHSIRDFFSAIFFVTVGGLVTVSSVEVLLFAGILVLLVVVFNPLVHTISFVLEGYDGRTGFLAGSSLNQISELSLVIVIQAWLLGTIADRLFDAIILAAAITMITSAFSKQHHTIIYDRVIEPIFAGRAQLLEHHCRIEESLADHVVLIGYGRQGRRIRSVLDRLDVPYIVIENDPAIKQDLEGDCQNFIFGDAIATQPASLANVAAARLIISTVDHRPVSESVLKLSTDADIILRASESREAVEYLDAGATFVSVPSVLAGDQLIENVERVLGDEGEIQTLEANHRAYLKEIEMAGLERSM